MAIPVLIIGKSGSGKSYSMRNCIGKDFGLIRVLNKPLPFRGKIPGVQYDEYTLVERALSGASANSIIIDDAGYLITNFFMRNHSTKGSGNAIFSMYNSMSDQFWGLIQKITSLPEDKIVYVIMHEDTNEFGDIKPKTIGKMLDEKVCLEGMFTIVLRCVSNGSEHKFITQSAGGAVSKSPPDMFEELEIENDLLKVDNAIRKYYEIENPKNNESEDK